MKRVHLIAISICAVVCITLSAIVGFALHRESLDFDNTIILDYWTHEDDARTNLETRLIEEFEALNPNVKINRKIYSSSGLLNVIPDSFEAGKGPDLFSLQQDSLSPLLNSDRLAPVDLSILGYSSYEEFADVYIKGTLSGSTREGIVYGVPMEFTNWCLYVNKKLFREAGLDPDTDYPRTWEEMLEISEILVERDEGILTTRGFDFRYPYYLTFFIPMVEQLGGSISSENGRLSLTNEDAWEKAFAFMQEWGPHGRNLGSPTYINARSIFNKGEIAMMLSGLYQEERLRQENPDLYYSDDWMIVPFPVFEGGKKISSAKYCHYWCVNAASSEDERAAAWSFIEFLSSHGMDYLNEVRLLNPKKEIIENLSDSNIPFLDVFLSELDYSEFVYSGESGFAIIDILESLMKEVMLSGLEPQKAVVRLRISLQELRP